MHADPNDGPVVYVIQDSHGGPVKIGYCNRRSGVPARLAAIQTGNPWALAVRTVLDAPQGIESEHALHEKLAEHRLVGEWFMNTPTVMWELGLKEPPRNDEARRLAPLLDSTFAAGRAAGRREAEEDFREQMRWVLDAGAALLAEMAPDDLEESVAERAARRACQAAGIRYPGRSRHEFATRDSVAA